MGGEKIQIQELGRDQLRACWSRVWKYIRKLINLNQLKSAIESLTAVQFIRTIPTVVITITFPHFLDTVAIARTLKFRWITHCFTTWNKKFPSVMLTSILSLLTHNLKQIEWHFVGGEYTEVCERVGGAQMLHNCGVLQTSQKRSSTICGLEFPAGRKSIISDQSVAC